MLSFAIADVNVVSAGLNRDFRITQIHEEIAGPKGFDPLACGSEDRRDILTTLRAHLATILDKPILYIKWTVSFRKSNQVPLMIYRYEQWVR